VQDQILYLSRCRILRIDSGDFERSPPIIVFFGDNCIYFVYGKFFLLIRNTFILSSFKYLLKPCVIAFRVVLHLLPYQGWKLGGYKIIMVSSVSGNANLDIQ